MTNVNQKFTDDSSTCLHYKGRNALPNRATEANDGFDTLAERWFVADR
jgi:hypothetical protein